MTVCSIDGCSGLLKGKGYCLKHYTRMRRYGSPDIVLKKGGSTHDRKYKTALEKFHANYEIVTESGCWIWKGSSYRAGYGQFRYSNIIIGAHRFSFMTFKGEIPENHFVCHKCDTPSCVNPDHLFCGTVHENFKDMRIKKRNAIGAKNGRSKLTEYDIVNIRKLKVRRGDTARICRIYGICYRTYYRIRYGQLWKDVVDA
jgi:hypothetical protein